MFNNLETKYYNIVEDCIFDNSCAITPNNHSFMNYKRPSNHSLFYSEKSKDINLHGKCNKCNCNCVKC